MAARATGLHTGLKGVHGLEQDLECRRLSYACGFHLDLTRSSLFRRVFRRRTLRDCTASRSPTLRWPATRRHSPGTAGMRVHRERSACSRSPCRTTAKGLLRLRILTPSPVSDLTEDQAPSPATSLFTSSASSPGPDLYLSRRTAVVRGRKVGPDELLGVGLPSPIGLSSPVWRSYATVGYEPAVRQALHPLFRAVGALTHAHTASSVSPDDGRVGGCAIWAAGETRTHAGDV